MDPSRLVIYVGYAMAAVFCCLGIIVLYGGVPGIEIPPSHVRTLTGCAMLLYSVFRFITTRTKDKQNHEDNSPLD
jgi:hypothetical protein